MPLDRAFGQSMVKNEGGCLCGGIRYEISGPLTRVENCHCSMCRRFLGWAFCRDSDPGVRPAEHIFVGSKAAWFEITDSLPRHDTWPPGRIR